MHVELELRFKKPVRWETASFAVREIIGANAVSISVGLEGSSIALDSNVIGAALAAEKILNVARIVYVSEGSDAIRVFISGSSIAEGKKQCARIARQISQRIGKLSSATANVFVVERGAERALIFGERILFFTRMKSGFAEGLAAKLAPSAVTFSLASYFMSGTAAVTSAAIGLVAASAGVAVEAAYAAHGASDWKWKEIS